jgi:hypothetical protein
LEEALHNSAFFVAEQLAVEGRVEADTDRSA